MRKLLVPMLVLITTMSFAVSGQTTSEPSEEARRKTLVGLYDVQDLILKDLLGSNGKVVATPVQLIMDRQDPEKRLGVMDAQNYTLLSNDYKAWQSSRSADDLLRFLRTINEAKKQYSPEIKDMTIGEFWQELLELTYRHGFKADREVIKQAEEDANWIRENLEDVKDLTPEAKKTFPALYRLLADYELTKDPRLIRRLASDLKIKRQHCSTTGNRADQPTQFTFDVIDENNTKLSSWVVYAISLATTEEERVGNPSNPVTGSLLPGDWVFLARKGNLQSFGERVTVSNSKTNPSSFLLRVRP